MITKKCGMTAKQKLFTILDKICYSTKTVGRGCYECEYYEDESWCINIDSEMCKKNCSHGRNYLTCDLIKMKEKWEWVQNE